MKGKEDGRSERKRERDCREQHRKRKGTEQRDGAVAKGSKKAKDGKNLYEIHYTIVRSGNFQLKNP